MRDFVPSDLVSTRWRCSECASNVIVEVTSEAKVKTRIDGITKDGKLVFGRHVEVSAGVPNYYECGCCGESLRNGSILLRTRQELVNFLLEK